MLPLCPEHHGVTLRPMAEEDRNAILDMMRGFYASDAVHTNGSDSIFQADIDACVGPSPYLEGWIFVSRQASIVGYAMLARSFSTEFGLPCIWVEDLFLKPDWRCLGLADAFFHMLREKFPETLLRLEAEEENRHAVHVYRKNGFEEMPYLELVRQPDRSEARP